MEKLKPKVIAVVGPTATGKSDLAVAIATACNGEVISADSRQIYRKLDIGTGKITKEEMRGIPHHMLDIADPDEQVGVTTYKILATEILHNILEKNKLPVIAGGTGQYIEAVVDGIVYPEVPPNESLRQELEQKDTEELFQKLQEADPARAQRIDKQNKRRIIRALEINDELGRVPKIQKNHPYNPLFIGIDFDDETLRARIQTRLKKRLDEGMVQEAEQLHQNGLSYERMDALGLEYRFLAEYLQGNITEKELYEQLEVAIWRYAKRQRTWFKRDDRIKWFTPDEQEEIIQTVKNFI